MRALVPFIIKCRLSLVCHVFVYMSNICTYVLILHMGNLTHHEFQLLTGVIGCIAFFTFTGIAYFINELTSKNK
jgi:hypothetical protein